MGRVFHTLLVDVFVYYVCMADGGKTWEEVSVAAEFAERYGFSFLVHASLRSRPV
jgi:hypothetical protein